MSLMRPSRCLPAALIRWRSGRKASAFSVFGLLLEHLGVPDDGVQRCPQLVGHVRQEVGLVPAGLSELCVGFLKLAEQSCVLDGDDGLVRERLDQRDLAVGVRRGRRAPQRQKANRLPISQQRHLQRRGIRMSEPGLGKLRLESRVSPVRAVNRSSVVQRFRSRSTPLQRNEIANFQFPFVGRIRPAPRNDAYRFAFSEPESRSRARGQPHRRFEDRLDHRLGAGRRGGDDAKHVRGRGLLLQRLGEGTVAASGLCAQRGDLGLSLHVSRAKLPKLRLQLRDPGSVVRHHAPVTAFAPPARCATAPG